jgi:hypothetical protein
MEQARRAENTGKLIVRFHRAGNRAGRPPAALLACGQAVTAIASSAPFFTMSVSLPISLV